MAYSGYSIFKAGGIGNSGYAASVFTGFAIGFLARGGDTKHGSFSVYVAGGKTLEI